MTTNRVSPVRAKPSDFLFPSGEILECSTGTCNEGTKYSIELWVPERGLTEFYTDDLELYKKINLLIQEEVALHVPT